MTGGRSITGLVVAVGLVLAVALRAWEARRWPDPFFGWELLLLAVTAALLTVVAWHALGAALAAWSGLDAAQAARSVALAFLPLLLVAGTPALRRGAGLVAMAGVLFVAATGWVFWRHRPRQRSRQAAVAAFSAAAAALRQPLAVVLLGLVLVDIRLLHLAADPPVELGPSGGAWTDPGEWAHNARNKVLTGRWVWDQVNFMYVSPITTFCFYLVFRVLGVGYAQVGLVSVLFSLATLGVFYLALKESMGRGGAVLSTLLLGGNYLYLTYNRVGLVETPAIFFQVLALYFAERGTRDPRFFALAGAAALMPLAVKMQLVYIFPAALLSVLVWSLRPGDHPEGRRSASPLVWFLGGAVATLATLAALWLIPSRAEIGWRIENERRLHTFALELDDFVHTAYHNPFFGYFWELGSRVLLVVSGVYFFRVLLRVLRVREPVPFPYVFALWWFVGGFAYLSISQYRPLRYYASLIPPMTILAGAALAELWRWRGTFRSPGPLSVWVASLGLTVAALMGVQRWYGSLAAAQRAVLPSAIYPLAERDLAVLAAALALTLSALTFRVLGPRIPRLLERVPAWAPRVVAAAIVLLFFLGEARSYLDWTLNRGYRLVSISRELGATLPPGSVLAGIYAPILVLENRHQGLAIWDRYGNWEGDPLGRFGVTHVVVMTYIDEIGYYRRRFPEAMGRARLLDEWTLWKTRVSLFELPRRG